MKTEKYLDPEKLNRWMKSVFDNAATHGWHDSPISKAQYCGLIMTEMAEAVEADRNGRRAHTAEMADVMKVQSKSEIGLCQGWYDTWFNIYYDKCVKGSIEEEFADVVLRVLAMAQDIHGNKMIWKGYYPYGQVYYEKMSFIENAWYFIREVLNWGKMNISDCVSFMYDWAHDLNIDLDTHIEWKMKFNELRPYKHGGKKY